MPTKKSEKYVCFTYVLMYILIKSLFKIKHCIAISKGDIDSATQILLHRQETNQCITDKSHTGYIKKNVVVDDNELKNRIIAR